MSDFLLDTNHLSAALAAAARRISISGAPAWVPLAAALSRQCFEDTGERNPSPVAPGANEMSERGDPEMTLIESPYITGETQQCS